MTLILASSVLNTHGTSEYDVNIKHDFIIY